MTVIEAGEINGVRIPKGVTITVGIEDARRLIETNKAIFTKGSAESVEGAEAGRTFQPENNTEIERQAEDIAEASAGDIGTEETSVEETGTDETQQTEEAQITETASPETDIKADADTLAETTEASMESETAKTEAGEETKDDDRSDQQK